jgi:Tol biopolymer transport system component
LSSDGRRALVPLAGHTAALIDVATGRSRTRHRLDQPDLSPDGREVVWVRDRGGRCDVAVRSLASGRTRSLRRLPCASEVTWDGPRIALLSWGRAQTVVFLLDPATGASRRRLSSRRVLGLSGTSPSGALRLVAFGDEHRDLATWLLRPDGARHPLPIRTGGRFDAR